MRDCPAWLRAGAALLLALALSGCPRPVTPGPEAPSTPRATPLPTPVPPPYVPNKRLEVGKIFNGAQIRTTLETQAGTTASADRVEPGSYAVEVKVRVALPQPHQDQAALTRLNPQLAVALADLPKLLESAVVSPAFDNLYRLKIASMEASLSRLDNLISKHNFYDCETILNLQHPESKRLAVLLQGDMDTDTDGSDSDRVPEIDGSSATFQPFTSYKWAKKTKQPNSFIQPRQTRLRQVQQEAAGSASRQQEVKGTVQRLKDEIADLGKYSYLVGSVDPYVVLPGSMFAGRARGQFTPAVGDYCLVIYGDTLYPAVVGDVGPQSVMGEASLRICRQINPKADSGNRPVNDLKVTYLLFPGSADRPFDVPNLEKWHERCEELLNEMGGTKGNLFVWEDLVKPKATPAPATPVPATPAPAATPAATPAAVN